MAQYKVPQNVEAEDKLLGPFTFRQFVYLLIAGGLIALAVALFQIFPLLAIIPFPPVLLLLALALPLKKDQPMETYLAAIVSYYLKPRTRTWTPGQRESTIKISAPKVTEDSRTRDITGEEATHRLSFLADIVDTEGQAIKGNINHPNEELAVEANLTNDIFETTHFDNLSGTIMRDENERHSEVMREMQEEIRNPKPKVVEKPTVPSQPEAKKVETKRPDSSIIELANNSDFSVATIAKEANRIKEKEEGEVFISLH